MSETRRTIYYTAAALALVILAWLASPRRYTPEAFLDQGKTFFPEFTDPNIATAMEVIDWDETTGRARPFKVQFKNGRWTIPSHHDYPADGKDRLAKTAAGVIDLKKDDFRTDNVAEYVACGVIDPLDEATAGSAGRGQRITIRGGNDQALADFIIGKFVPGKAEYRFVRVPDQKRVYAVKMNLEISTRFEDWIDRDLLQMTKDQIAKIIRRDYSINERTGTVDQRDNVVISQKDGKWLIGGATAPDSTAMQNLLTAIDQLSIEGVRRKPEGLSASLRQTGSGSLTQADVLSLQSKGFYITRDGQLLSNEGEMQVQSKDGITYTLRFGEVLHGSGLMITSGEGEEDAAKSGAAASRYLFLTCDFDPKFFPEPKNAPNTGFQGKADSLLTEAEKESKRIWAEHNQWKERVDRSSKLAQDLNRRFADWYYVISSDSFEKLHVKRSDLAKKKG
ncbi:MAG: DUF4340 domain-containing protein [candidate division Zixibacteria bacterium]|nr:DUF4340 domain-containing protein [candidate division Zixibacteria bacterium]